VPKFASASQQVVETEQRVKITAARKDPSPVPRQVIEAASSSGPSRMVSVAPTSKRISGQELGSVGAKAKRFSSISITGT
jgi:hypothetical protein